MVIQSRPDYFIIEASRQRVRKITVPRQELILPFISLHLSEKYTLHISITEINSMGEDQSLKDLIISSSWGQRSHTASQSQWITSKPVTCSCTASCRHQLYYFQGLLSSRNTVTRSGETLNWQSCQRLDWRTQPNGSTARLNSAGLSHSNCASPEHTPIPIFKPTLQQCKRWEAD